MRSLLELFGLGTPADAPAGDTATVRRIVDALEALDGDQARFLASFAYLLSRVANADFDITDDETQAMEAIVRDKGGLPEAQAVLAVEIAKGQARLFGGTEDFQVAREFKRITERSQRIDLLDCLFAVAAADGVVTSDEEEQIRRVADELGLTHRELADVRSNYNEYRAVLKRLDR